MATNQESFLFIQFLQLLSRNSLRIKPFFDAQPHKMMILIRFIYFVWYVTTYGYGNGYGICPMNLDLNPNWMWWKSSCELWMWFIGLIKNIFHRWRQMMTIYIYLCYSIFHLLCTMHSIDEQKRITFLKKEAIYSCYQPGHT